MKDITSFDFIDGVDKVSNKGNYTVFLQKKYFKDFPKIQIYNIILKKVDDGVKARTPEPLKNCYRGLVEMLTPAPSPFVLKVSGYNQKYKFLIKRINRQLERYNLEGFFEVGSFEDENGTKQQFYFLIKNEEEKKRLFNFLNGR